MRHVVDLRGLPPNGSGAYDTTIGDLYIADMGLTRWEEVNRIPAGVASISLGWPCYQGEE